MTDLQRFLQIFAQEHATTLKVMKAFPADKLAWRPHERSMNARELMFRFMGEQMVMAKLPSGGFPVPPPQQPVPESSLEQLLATFEQGYQEVMGALKGVTEDDFNNKSTSFFGNEMKLSDACWIPVKDQIHHRGQLSVYVRMAGGKVPSIYGPSADDPGM